VCPPVCPAPSSVRLVGSNALRVESTNPVKKDDEAMDVVEEADKSTSADAEASANKKKSSKIQRRARNRHSKNSVIFPSMRKNAAKKAGKSKRK
jgi:hypothetical protein